MTRADEILAATLNLLGTPDTDEPAAVKACLRTVHKRADHSHPARWAWRTLTCWSHRHHIA